MWSSSGSPATLPRHTAGSSAPVDWDSLLPLLPESVRLLRQVLEDDAALHRLLEHCGGLTLRIPRRFPSEGHLLRALLPDAGPRSQILVAGLGNRAMTPDAIGPAAVENLLVTRHMVRTLPRQFRGFTPVSALCTGVLARTGLETLELIQGAAAHIRPTAVIAIDALAARSRDRLCATVQLSDTGLTPGSGVGNHRRAVDRAALGVPVIAVGVPTVIDGATLCADLLEEAGCPRQALCGRGADLFVTPQDIDQRVTELGRMVGYGITLALQRGLTLEDVTGLLG